MAEALAGKKPNKTVENNSELSAALAVSTQEKLAQKDFAQMSAAEIAEAIRLVARLRLPHDAVKMRRQTRRSARGRGRSRGDRFAGRCGPAAPASNSPGAVPKKCARPSWRCCDISGSMSDYTRVFLHFLHCSDDAAAQRSFFLVRHPAHQRHAVASGQRSRRGLGGLRRRRARLGRRHAHRLVAAPFQQGLVAASARAGRHRCHVHGRAGARRPGRIGARDGSAASLVAVG